MADLYFRIHPAHIIHISSHIISKSQWPSSTGSYNVASTMFDRWSGKFWIMSFSFPYQHSSLLIKLILASSIVKTIFFQIWSFFTWVLPLALHLAVKPLCVYIHEGVSWLQTLTMIRSTCSRVFLTWLDVVKQFFFTEEWLLRSSNLVVFSRLPGVLVFLPVPNVWSLKKRSHEHLPSTLAINSRSFVSFNCYEIMPATPGHETAYESIVQLFWL